MDPLLIDRFFHELFQSGLLASEVTVLWHSGEPLTLPPDYYDQAITSIHRLKSEIAPEKLTVRFGIQTNGVLIDEDWCRFFKRHSELLEVGVSCDGPSDLHDIFRVNWSGGTTHAQTLRGMDLLHSHGIKYKLIAVVTRPTLAKPEDFYKFFFERREQLSGFHFNILASGDSPCTNLSYAAEDRTVYRTFYERLLELNRESRNAGCNFEILNFTQSAARILANKSESAWGYSEQATAPLRSVSLDASGNVTTFYAGLSIDTLRNEYGDGKGLSLGNILEDNLENMIRSEKLERMMGDFTISRGACRARCDYFSVCPGGFEVLKRQTHGNFRGCETKECVIHVKTLVDVLLDDMQAHVTAQAG